MFLPCPVDFSLLLFTVAVLLWIVVVIILILLFYLDFVIWIRDWRFTWTCYSLDAHNTTQCHSLSDACQRSLCPAAWGGLRTHHASRYTPVHWEKQKVSKFDGQLSISSSCQTLRRTLRLLLLYYFDRRIYLSLSKSTQSATGMTVLKPAAN